MSSSGISAVPDPAGPDAVAPDPAGADAPAEPPAEPAGCDAAASEAAGSLAAIVGAACEAADGLAAPLEQAPAMMMTAPSAAIARNRAGTVVNDVPPADGVRKRGWRRVWRAGARSDTPFVPPPRGSSKPDVTGRPRRRALLQRDYHSRQGGRRRLGRCARMIFVGNARLPAHPGEREGRWLRS